MARSNSSSALPCTPRVQPLKDRPRLPRCAHRMIRGIAGRGLTAGRFKTPKFSKGNGMVPPSSQATFAARLRSDPNEQAEFRDHQPKSIQRMVSERRIYRLTPHADSNLMWSHYAETHLGICLEFGLDNPLFRAIIGLTHQQGSGMMGHLDWAGFLPVL